MMEVHDREKLFIQTILQFSLASKNITPCYQICTYYTEFTTKIFLVEHGAISHYLKYVNHL